MADSSDLILIYISIPGYHQQQKQKQQQEQINAATSRFHPYSLNTNQTSIPSSPFSDFATVSSDQKSKGSSGHGTSLASSSLGSSNSSTSISQHPPLACSTITRSRSRLPPGLHSDQFDEQKYQWIKRSFLYYVSKGTGWVGSEKWQFLLTFSTVYADIGWLGGSEKVQKWADVV